MKKPVILAGIILLLVIGIGLYVLLSGSGNGGNLPTENATANVSAINVTAPATAENGPWEIAGPGPVWQLATASDGTLYSFQGPYGNTIRAIAPNGSIEWTYQVPDEWRVSNVLTRPVANQASGYPDFTGPVYSIDNGVMYLYVRENKTTDFNYYPFEDSPGHDQYKDYLLKEQLMAIAGGQLLWDVPISDEHHSFDDDSVYAQDGRIYVFDDYAITVFNSTGAKLFRIDNASSPPAVDEDGNFYLVPAVPATDESISYAFSRYQDVVFKVPSSLVQAYSPNGTLIWQKDMGAGIVRSVVDADTLPVYQNHTLYVQDGNGFVGMGTDGNVKWGFYWTITNPIPIKMVKSGNTYLLGLASYGNTTNYYDPWWVTNNTSAGIQYTDVYAPLENPAVYDIQSVPGVSGLDWDGSSVNDTSLSLSVPSAILVSGTAPVDEQSTGDLQWQTTVSMNGTIVTMDTDNAAKLLSMDKQLIDKQPTSEFINGTATLVCNLPETSLNTLSSNDTAYVYAFFVDYEVPAVINQSRCYYAGIVCALNSSDGTLLWSRQLDALVTSMTVSNNTLYYGTRDGRIFGGITRSDPGSSHLVAAMVSNDMGKVVGTVAGGATVAAAALLFLKFFGIGGLARARGRLSKNDYRNRTLRFVADHPGSTLHEIAHGLEMNVGTVRYHLLVLSLNHRVITFKSDGKFVRYFTNAGTYTKSEQFVLTLIRRDQVRKILGLLLVQAGLSNLEISEALGMHESATSRYLKELTARGVVTRHDLEGGRTSYSIYREYQEPVAKALKRIDSN